MITPVQEELLRAAVSMLAKKEFHHLLYIGDLPLPEELVKAKSMARKKLVQAVTSDAQRQLVEAMGIQALSLPTYDIARPERFKMALVGGIAKAVNDSAITFVGSDSDAKYKIYSWDQVNQKWLINTAKKKTDWQNKKGPMHAGQFRPTEFKTRIKVEETCTTYNRTKFDGLQGRDGTALVLAFKTYKDSIRSHCIKMGMHHVFMYTDPKTKKPLDLFNNSGKFKLKQI